MCFKIVKAIGMSRHVLKIFFSSQSFDDISYLIKCLQCDTFQKKVCAKMQTSPITSHTIQKLICRIAWAVFCEITMDVFLRQKCATLFANHFVRKIIII
jgi:hypothetical protein